MTTEPYEPSAVHQLVMQTVVGWLDDGVDGASLAAYLSYTAASIIVNMPKTPVAAKRMMLAIIDQNIKAYTALMLLEPGEHMN